MRRPVQTLVLAGIVFVVACGGDSANPIAPRALTSSEALQSLTRGLTTLNNSTVSSGSDLSFAMLSPMPSRQTPTVGQLTVTVDGTPLQMYGVAERAVYPAGTCLEQLVGISTFGGEPSCTEIPGALTLILWQTSSASQPPDRLLFVLAGTGTSTFIDALSGDENSFLAGGAFPALGFYMERSGAMWVTSGGSLSSSVAAGGQSCTMPLPVFATAATCATGSFSESGSLSFAPFDMTGVAATGTHTISVSGQTLTGTIQTVTATAPLTFP